jgi:phytoene synthase
VNAPNHPPAHPAKNSSRGASPLLGRQTQVASANSIEVLAKHGKSFRFAGRFLSPEVLQDCARLYHFCRMLDDVVDETDDTLKALAAVNKVRFDLKQQSSSDPVVQDFIKLAHQYSFDSDAAQELLSGLASDLTKVECCSETELKRYSYRVAGVVGIFMCRIMGVNDVQALAHGIDLGIAMQMTNIARDVVEDAAAGRRYLPADWVEHCSPQELLSPNRQQAAVVRCGVKRLLSEADRHYYSAWKGLKYLPLRNRIAIAVAAEVYRGIGVKLSRHDYNIWDGRVRLGLLRKSALAMKALLKLLIITIQKDDDTAHPTKLHSALVGLPLANASPDKVDADVQT